MLQAIVASLDQGHMVMWLTGLRAHHGVLPQQDQTKQGTKAHKGKDNRCLQSFISRGLVPPPSTHCLW